VTSKVEAPAPPRPTAERASTPQRPRTRLTRRGRVVVWVLAAAGLQAMALGLIRLSGPEASAGLLAAVPLKAPVAPVLVAPGPRPAPLQSLPMASIRGITLNVPGSRVVGIGYHEAALRDAMGLHPQGHLARNANRTKFTDPGTTLGPAYIIMSSRGRAHPATSAVDVAMPSGARVLAPVTGKVISVKKYYLYGRYLDYRVDIRPSDNSKLRVVLIHLMQLSIRRLDEVTAGVTPLGQPRTFPFHSQINDYVGAGVPHVHIEVKELGA
jgi:murein DD-endopeptidase MepM/ murein hydrolase activator NlpD